MEKIIMERLRLLFWSETFYPTIGGTEVSLYRQIQELLRFDNKITVISTDKNKDPLLINEGKEGIFQRIELDNKNCIFEAIEKIKNLNGIEILYITRVFKKDPLTHLRAIKEISHDIDTVLRIPTQGNIDILSGYPLDSFLDEIAGFICLNDAIQEEIKRNIKNPRIYSHRNGIPMIDFCENKFEKTGPYLFIGRFTKTKGLSILFEAWRKYKSSGGRKKLMVCGSFDSNYIFKEIKDKDFLEYYDIKYIGVINDIWQYLENIYALIIPSIREGHTNVMLEAMASGIPVIASNIPGLKEDILESSAGVLFNAGDINELFNRMQEFEKDMYDLDKMSENGQNFVRNNRTITHTIESFYRIIKEIKKEKKVFCN